MSGLLPGRLQQVQELLSTNLHLSVMGTNGKWAGFPEAARQWLVPKKKPIVFDSAFVLDVWKEKTASGFIDYIKLKNGVLITVKEIGISVYDADDLVVPGSTVEFRNITTRQKQE